MFDVFCHVEVSADHSSRGVRPSVIEEPHAGGLGPLGVSSHEKKRSKYECIMRFPLTWTDKVFSTYREHETAIFK